jgi:hypothetical protein
VSEGFVAEECVCGICVLSRLCDVIIVNMSVVLQRHVDLLTAVSCFVGNGDCDI